MVQGAVQHELNPVDRAGSHRMVATGMLITFLVVAISQNWWTHLRDFVSEKTHGAALITPPGGTTTNVPGVTTTPGTAGGSSDPRNPTGAF